MAEKKHDSLPDPDELVKFVEASLENSRPDDGKLLAQRGNAFSAAVALLEPQSPATQEGLGAILGKDFLGSAGIRIIGEKLARVRVDLVVPEVQEAILPSLRETRVGKRLVEILEFIPSYLGGDREPLTIETMFKIFGRDPDNRVNPMFDPSKEWVYSESFYRQSLAEAEGGFIFVKKYGAVETVGKPWDFQRRKMEEYGERANKEGSMRGPARLLTATEHIWTGLAYYLATGERLLANVLARTSTHTDSGNTVYVGNFGLGGIQVVNMPPEENSARSILVTKR